MNFYENKLTTTCNNKILESGGTIYIQAYDDDGIVKIANDKSLSVVFETQRQGLQNEMDIYFGHVINNWINWIKVDEKQKFKQA